MGSDPGAAPLKIQLASDLHLEFLAEEFPGERFISPGVDADVLVIAGDIASGANAIALFANWPVPVLYVAGNHEFYGSDIDCVEQQLRLAARGTQVHFLEQDALVIGGCRFLGTALWTDYALNEARGVSVDAAMNIARSFLTDHSAIRLAGHPFAPVDALMRHEAAISWLKCALGQPFDGPTVVVTHHGVHPLSVHPKYVEEGASAAFVSDLGPLLSKADLWVHGHVHDSFDYRVHGSRIVANPRGYPLNHREVNRADRLRFENGAFDPMLVIEVDG